MLEWLNHLETHKKLLVEASRDHGKSWLFSYLYPLFSIQRIKNPKEAISIALISYSEEQAKKNLARIRKAIESNPSLKWLMPKSKSYTWESGMLNMSNDCTVESFGFGSSIRGGHYHKVIVDDPCKDHGTMSVPEQENFLFGAVVPAVRRGGQIVVTGNPVDKQDFLEVIERNKEFKHFFYPCINEKGQPLWPEQYTLADLDEKRRMQPPHMWAREYMLKRVSSADSKFKEEWIKYYQDYQIQGRLYKTMTIDPALSPGGDAMAAVVTGYDKDGNVFVLDRMSFHGDFKTGIGELCDFMERNFPDFIGCEDFAFQAMYRIWLEEEIERRGLPFHVQPIGRDSKKSKAARIEALQPKLAQGKLWFRQEHKPLIDQLLLWDPLSKHNDDDEIDALAWQVPLWTVPDPGAEPEKPAYVEGSFNEAMAQSQRANLGQYAHLWEDMQ